MRLRKIDIRGIPKAEHRYDTTGDLVSQLEELGAIIFTREATAAIRLPVVEIDPGDTVIVIPKELLEAACPSSTTTTASRS